MVQNIIKYQIASSLLTGLILALFIFIGNLAKDFLSEQIKNFKKDYRFKFGLFFLVLFLIVMNFILMISFAITNYRDH